MKDCCEEFRKIIVDVEAMKMELPASMHERLDKIIAFVKAQWDSHVNDAGEASWRGE